MPRPIPASYTPIDPQELLTGEPLLADSAAPLSAASNWLDAHSGRTDCISQSFVFSNVTATTPCARIANTSATVATWQIPELSGVTQVFVVVACKVRPGPVGSNHLLQVTSVNGGGSFSVTGGSGLDATVKFFSGTVAVAWVGGYERINLRLRADGVSSLEVWSILVTHAQPTSLPAGRQADGRMAFDGEISQDNPLSARTMQALHDNETAFNARPHVAVNVSDLQSVDVAGQDRLQPYQHRWACVRMPDTESQDRTLSVSVTVSTPLGAGVLRFGYAGTADLSGEGGQVAVQLAVGKVRATEFLDPITQLDVPSITAQQVGMLWHGLSLWPQPDPATWDVPVGTSACDIHGVLVWGWQ